MERKLTNLMECIKKQIKKIEKAQEKEIRQNENIQFRNMER